jgi:menaquinone-dependent protoporphyrinogen IX oxidase
MGKKENLMESCLYNEMREAAIEIIEKQGLEKREISDYFDDYTLKVPIYFQPIFMATTMGISLDSYAGKKVAVASLTQMERPKGSAYNFNVAFTLRPTADINAPILHGEAQDPMLGVKGMFSMDLLNYNKKDIDLEKFLGPNVAKVKEALEIVDKWQKTKSQGRGKYTKYLAPYKSEYRIELEQPDAADLPTLKKYHQDCLAAFTLIYQAYFDSLAKVKASPKSIAENKIGMDEYISTLMAKDFAAKQGKRLFGDDFTAYFATGFWNIGDYGPHLQPKKKTAGFVPGEPKKGLIVYNSVYGSTIEAAYWLRALLGLENYIEVKRHDQVISVKPFDYVIIGSHTRQEKPTKAVYDFAKKHKHDLITKDLAMFLTCGDVDETQILNIPGGPDPHLIGGRNYFNDFFEKHPDLKPIAIAGFGGRQVMPTLNPKDQAMIFMVGKLAKEGAAWAGLDIWESLVPERVEYFANEVREKILGIEPVKDPIPFRTYWNSVQPATLSDRSLKKFKPKPFSELINSNRVYYSRSRIKGDMEQTIDMLNDWAEQSGTKLYKQSKTFFNVYYHAVKNYGGKKDVTIHVTVADLPEDPGNVHLGFRVFEKKKGRAAAEDNVKAAEALLWGDDRKVEDEE